MKLTNLKEAILEAERFLKRAGELRNEDIRICRQSRYQTKAAEEELNSSGSFTAAVRRSSMDLTRSLSKLRNE